MYNAVESIKSIGSLYSIYFQIRYLLLCQVFHALQKTNSYNLSCNRLELEYLVNSKKNIYRGFVWFYMNK